VSGGRRRVLLVAYPLLPVSEDSAGGAEQILWTLERELAQRGWQTEVAACAGSRVAGRLLVTGEAARTLDGFAEREREHTERVAEACAAGDYELVLDHSGHFFRHVAEYATRAPVLASLHLPRELYGADAFANIADNVFFHCVSEAQRREFLHLPRMLGVVRNGIAVERFDCETLGDAKPDDPVLPATGGEYLLWLARVCPEKAAHLAIAAAERAGLPIVLAGQVYPFASHRQYWEREIAPRIDGQRVRWIELPTFAEKCTLLREARALLVSSQIAETTSLVALEAMASGTPVIAFCRGALAEVVGQGTGFLVNSVEEMARACGRLGEIRPQDCRAWVEREYSAQAMVDRYEAMMRTLASKRAAV
jgi:glycosyltransferase involved in cell wall biosynthesis